MRKGMALALCILLLLPLLWSGSRCVAAENYLITITEDTVQEGVEDNEIAVYIDGIIYAPYSFLRSIDNVYVTYNARAQRVTVWRVGSTMYFDLAAGLAYDEDEGRALAIPAKMRGGVPYLPVSLVTAWMKMHFTFVSAADSGVGYPVIRLSGSAEPKTGDATVLANNAAKLLEVAQARNRLSGILVDTPPTQQPPPVQPVLPVRDIALLFTGASNQENLSGIMTVLERFSLPAAFFLGEGDLSGGAAAREVCARGFSPGILLTDGEDPAAEAGRAAELWAQAAHVRVRLVCAPELELTEEQREALEQAGFVIWDSDNDPYGAKYDPQRMYSQVRQLLRNAADRSTLRLEADGVTWENLSLICSYLEAQNFAAEAVQEWSEPF